MTSRGENKAARLAAMEKQLDDRLFENTMEADGALIVVMRYVLEHEGVYSGACMTVERCKHAKGYFLSHLMWKDNINMWTFDASRSALVSDKAYEAMGMLSTLPKGG